MFGFWGKCSQAPTMVREVDLGNVENEPALPCSSSSALSIAPPVAPNWNGYRCLLCRGRNSLFLSLLEIQEHFKVEHVGRELDIEMPNNDMEEDQHRNEPMEQGQMQAGDSGPVKTHSRQQNRNDHTVGGILDQVSGTQNFEVGETNALDKELTPPRLTPVWHMKRRHRPRGRNPKKWKAFHTAPILAPCSPSPHSDT